MSIDRAGAQYWLKPVNAGQYWSIANSLVNKHDKGFFPGHFNVTSGN
jgi:hypothetical protein